MAARAETNDPRSADDELERMSTVELVLLLLESSAYPAIVLDGDGSILATNAAGHRILQECPLETLRTGALVDLASGSQRALRRELVGANGACYEVLLVRPVGISPAEMLEAAVAHWSPTPRQRDVLRGLIDGLSNKEIALASGCSYRTVEVHVHALLQRAGVNTRARLVAKTRALAGQARPSEKSDTVLRAR